MYQLTYITHLQKDKILKESPGWWEWICENNHGNCHWNSHTGEIMWIPDNGEKVKFSKKK